MLESEMMLGGKDNTLELGDEDVEDGSGSPAKDERAAKDIVA